MKLSIKYKIFFTLLLTSIIVATGLHSFLSWNLDRGFAKYIQSQELEQLDKLSEQLIVHYKTDENWQFIVDNHSLWIGLHLDTSSVEQTTLERQISRPTGQRPPQERQIKGLSNQRSPHDPPPNNLGPRIILLDKDKNRIIGAEDYLDNLKDLKLRPIIHQESTIGYLGITPPKEFLYARDRLFIKDQTNAFALIAVCVVALSIMLSYPVTMHLLRPIHALTNGTRKLMAGKFKNQIPVTTHDELGQLSVDFNILAKTLDKNEENRQQWVADVSHELRTPLAILRGEVEAIQDGVRKAEPNTISALHSEILHMERIVADLYELSKSDIGALDYKRVDVNAAGLLRGVVEQFTNRIEKEELEIHLDIATGSHHPILADPDRLQQLFTNLLENSFRYTDRPGQIAIHLKNVDENMIISFEDSAPDVPSGQFAKLFDRLYRVEGSRNRITGGTGLGLAICKNIVEAHQGTIVAKNSPLGGILINITLPKNHQTTNETENTNS